MKKIFLILIAFVLVSGSAFAKKVKFAVDMCGVTVSPLGVRVTGDFQTAAGFPGGDWTTNTLLTQETADTNIYSTVVDIPAFAKYEYKFVNGDQFYEAEFVPLESRVGYNFNDNRWIYIDSLANDTTFVGSIRFAGNAPKNKKLVRFYVDMQNETVSSNGVHVAGSFQSWNAASTIMYTFADPSAVSVYEIIAYVDSLSTYEYKFYNGNTLINTEIVPGACATNSNRSFTSVNDTLMSTVCFSACSACSATSIAEETAASFQFYPNPTDDQSVFMFNAPLNKASVFVYDVAGRLVQNFNISNQSNFTLQRGSLSAGIYTVTVDADSFRSNVKWIIK